MLKKISIDLNRKIMNMNDIAQKITKYTKLSQAQRSKALRWLARQNETLVHFAFQKQKEHYFVMSKTNEEDKSLVYLCALYLATNELFNLQKSMNSKSKSLNLQDVADVTALQAKAFQKNRIAYKYEKLLNLQSKIATLIEKEKLSFRDVAKFLEKYHRLKVSHTLIHQFYRDIRSI